MDSTASVFSGAPESRKYSPLAFTLLGTFLVLVGQLLFVGCGGSDDGDEQVVPNVGGNLAPTATAQTVATTMDTDRAIRLTGTDPENASLTFVVVDGPSSGSLAGTAPNMIYTPNAGYTGADSFTYKANDGEYDSNIATVRINIQPAGAFWVVMTEPSENGNVALNERFTLKADVSDSTAIKWVNWFIVGKDGVAAVDANGAPYEANLRDGYQLTEGGNYDIIVKAWDESNALLGQQTITVTAGTVIPGEATADGQSLTTNQDTQLSITLTGTDPNSATLNFQTVTSPNNGTLGGAAPNVTYTPNTGYTGADTFTFKVNDSAPATVSINVRPTNGEFWISMTEPVDGGIVALNERFTLKADVSDSTGIKWVNWFIVGKDLPAAADNDGAPYESTLKDGYQLTEAGDYDIIVKAWDNSNSLLGQQTISVKTAGPAGQPVIDSAPTANPASIMLTELDTVSLSVVAHDPDNSPQALTYRWTDTGNTGNVTFANAGRANTTATFAAGGNYSLEVVVSDGEFATTGSVRVTVLEPASGLRVRVISHSDGQIVPVSERRVDFFVAIDNPDNVEWENLRVYLDGVQLANKHPGEENEEFMARGGISMGVHRLRVVVQAPEVGNSEDMLVDTGITFYGGEKPHDAPTVWFENEADVISMRPGSLTIKAGAADDGSVVSVELFHNDRSAQKFNTAGPAYTFNPINVGAGANTFRLVATDDGGKTTAAMLTVVAAVTEQVTHDDYPQLEFAADQLRKALAEKNDTTTTVQLRVNQAAAGNNAYNVVVSGNSYTINGTNANEGMYGGLELAENLELGIPTNAGGRSPLVGQRGIKFNIPLDARSPSYDDSGTCSNKNYINMWDFETFWRPYLDRLAKYRYNVLSLWTCHPFAHMVKLDEYPDINEAEKDVYAVAPGILNADSNGKYIVSTFRYKNAAFEPGYLDTNESVGLRNEDGRLILGDGFVDYDKLIKIKSMTIEQKVAHWKKVFQHAKDRGMDITMFHWNIYAYGSKGHYGIEEDQDNPQLREFLRYAVKELVTTYPEITAIGVAAGENDNEGDNPDYIPQVSTEKYIYETYGLGVKDAIANTGRKIKFIWRNHSTTAADVKREFTDKYDPGNTGLVAVSLKYTVGHLYSSRRPQEWEMRSRDWLNSSITGGYDYPIWMNLRNDDTFVHRWASPDFVKKFIDRMPLEHSPGFMLGADGYVWGKIFESKVPELQGQLAIDKHWFHYRLWGQLAYNNNLDRGYWEKVLQKKFNLNATVTTQLYDAWETVSETVPQLNRSVWETTDAAFQAEGMCYRINNSTGFLTIKNYYYAEAPGNARRLPMNLGNSPVPGEVQCIGVKEWFNPDTDGTQKAEGFLEPANKLTPLEVADNLDSYSKAVTDRIAILEAASNGVEYKDLLLDLQSMAALGRFCADRQRCAAWYYAWRQNGRNNAAWKSQADNYIDDAYVHWAEYAEIMDSHYYPQVLARTTKMDWYATLNGPNLFQVQTLEKEVEAIKGGNY